jgi:hypothetical protein
MSLNKIGVCQFEYVIEPLEESEESRSKDKSRLLRFQMFVARDTLGVFIMVCVCVHMLCSDMESLNLTTQL